MSLEAPMHSEKWHIRKNRAFLPAFLIQTVFRTPKVMVKTLLCGRITASKRRKSYCLSKITISPSLMKADVHNNQQRVPKALGEGWRGGCTPDGWGWRHLHRLISTRSLSETTRHYVPPDATQQEVYTTTYREMLLNK